MSDQAQKLEKYKSEAESQLKECGESDIDGALLDELVSNLKLVINNRDALYVAGTDESELETVRKNFVVKKLGVSDKDSGTAVVKAVAGQMAGVRLKNRAAFYYLVKKSLA